MRVDVCRRTALDGLPRYTTHAQAEDERSCVGTGVLLAPQCPPQLWVVPLWVVPQYQCSG